MGLHPPFWWFADVANSDTLLKEIASSEVSSTIRKSDEWIRRMREGAQWFRHKHGIYPTQAADSTPEQVIQILQNIKTKYARKVLE